MVKGEGGIDSNTNIDELRDFTNKKRRCQGREVAADCPLSRAPSSAGCLSRAPNSATCCGLVKTHDLDFVGVDG
jgi:hypothetical protein